MEEQLKFSSAVISAFIAAFMVEIVSKGSSYIINGYSNYASVDENLETVKQLVPKIKTALEESERRSITNEQLLRWLRVLTETAYQADYVLKTFKYQAMIEYEENARRSKIVTEANKKFKDYIPSPHNIAKHIRTSFKSAKRMIIGDKEITRLGTVLQRLERAVYDVSELRKLLEKFRPVVTTRTIRTPLYMDKGRVFSRQVETERILNFLFQPSTRDDQRVDVLPVIGAEGMGKTTLALHACNNERVHNHFSLIIFTSVMCIEKKSDLVLVLRKILDRSCRNNSFRDEDNLLRLQKLVRQQLKDKRFLIVLDDLLDVNQITWSMLHDYLSCGKEGSKIIATSPSKETLVEFGVEAVELTGFQKEEYWFFFKEHAFGSANPEDHPRLALIGREIAKRMQGSPLAARVLGKLLRDKLSFQHWVNVLQNVSEHELWISCTLFDVCSLALRLMPGELKLLRVCYSPCLRGKEIWIDNLEEELVSGLYSRKTDNSGTPGLNVNRLRVLVSRTRFPTNHCMYHTFDMEVVDLTESSPC